ncbi:hypothetical protein H0I76_11510 [Limibaculum sp. M0105]|uniref:Uncharacterized protein n=1 Tax=Thermohalobaculum xanthum TaxID=2753746 RepID=A0A8J7M9C8_9RHOB|nr:hypothetical protein [Thermohalobaculum xanthum]MBK0399819.1 hypothetical protein [Thermohalobaculum xanthum]
MSALTDWISAAASIASAGAVIWGLRFAKDQLSIWKTEARDRRQAEVAEELWAAAMIAKDVLDSLRSPLEKVPQEEANNPSYIYHRRWSRMVERNDAFQNLRHAQIRAKAVLRNDAVESAVDILFSSRSALLHSFETLAELTSLDRKMDADERDLAVKHRRRIYGRGDEGEQLDQELAEAVTTLEKELGPIVRLEVIKTKR